MVIGIGVKKVVVMVVFDGDVQDCVLFMFFIMLLLVRVIVILFVV